MKVIKWFLNVVFFLIAFFLLYAVPATLFGKGCRALGIDVETLLLTGIVAAIIYPFVKE